MKTWYAWATPSVPIRLIEGDKMPVMKYWPEGTPMLTDYEKAIERAIASGTPVPDTEKAKDLIEKLRIDLGADAKVWDSYLGKEGAIYGPFTVGYWIHNIVNISHGITGLHTDVKQIAILYDDTPEKEESQEGIFDQLFCRYFDILKEGHSMYTATQQLTKEFIITRKQ